MKIEYKIGKNYIIQLDTETNLFKIADKLGEVAVSQTFIDAQTAIDYAEMKYSGLFDG